MNRLIISVIAPWVLTGALLIIATVGMLAIPTLLKGLRTLPKAVTALFLLICIAGTVVRFAWVPNTHRIYFDEDRYLMYAVSFARTGKALGIQIATPTDVLAGDPDPGARVTVPLIHAWVMKLFGYTDHNLFITAKILSALQILLLFLLTYLILKRPVAALFSSLGIALLPITVFWSTTTNLDSLFVCFALMTGIAAAWYAKKISAASILFLAASFSLLLFVRIEGLLYLFTAVWIIVAMRKNDRQAICSRRDLPILALFLPILFARILVALPLFTQTWCCAEATPLEIFQLGYFWRNTIPNLQTLFVQKEFPFIITVLSFVTLFGLTNTNAQIRGYTKSKIGIFAMWILTYFLLYSFYYVGIFYSYTFSGSYGRFFLMLVPPFLILAGMAVDYGYTIFRTASHKNKTKLLVLAFGALLTLYPTITTYRTTISISPWDRLVDEGPRLMRAFLTEDFIPNTPRDALIIHPLTGSVLMSGRTAVSIEGFVFKKQAIDFVKAHLKKGKPVYMLATDVCDATPYKCALVGNTFIYTPLDIPNQKVPGFSALTVTINPTP